MKHFGNAAAYLSALEKDAAYSIIPVQMVADILAVGRSAVTHRVRNGSLEAIQIGSTRYILAASLSNLLDEHQTEVKAVKGFLIEIAQCGASTTYAPVMGKINRSTTVPHDRLVIGKILGQISEESFEEHGFLLSAMVMKGKLGRPSDAFFGLAEQIDARYGKAASNEAYLKDQLKRIHKHYAVG